MTDPRFKVVAIVPNGEPQRPKNINPTQTRRQEAQAKYERLWHLEPEKFDPLKDCWGRTRIARIKQIVMENASLRDKKCTDLGCGWGVITRWLTEQGGTVDAVDIASQPLDKLKKDNLPQVRVMQDYVPHTLLNDSDYDLVVAAEIVSELPQQEYRLFFSELGRLVKKDGLVVCSSAIDIYSSDAFDRFRTIAETELDIIAWQASSNYLWIKLGNVLKAPERFARASQDNLYREKKLKERHGPIQSWFKLNSSHSMGYFWKGVSYLSKPLKHFLEQQSWLLISLEKISNFFWNENAVSHVIILAKRKPMIPKVDPSQIPPERQQRKRIWE